MSNRLAIHGGTPVLSEPFDGPTHDYDEQDIAAVTEVIRSGNLAKGPQNDLFEQEFAERYGVKHAVSVTSGTAAMHVCIGAINPDPGDEIIVTPWTAGGTIIGALLHNCVPVFADVDDTHCMDPEDVEAKITPRTRAIIAVHLLGNMCDMVALKDIAKRHNLFLVEDCAQSHFAEDQGMIAGSIGDIAGFSFGGKHLSIGGGGMVTTNNESLWERALLFRDAALPRDNGPYEGRPYANYFLAPGYRLNDLMAAVGRVQLRRVDGYVENKVRDAKNILDGLSDLEEIVPQKVRPGVKHTYWALGFTIDTRALNCTAKGFGEAVKAEGIPAYAPYLGTPEHGPLYRNPFLAEPNMYGATRFPFDYKRDKPIDYRLVSCPYGDDLMGRWVGNQMLPSFTEEYVGEIIAAYRKVVFAFRERS